MIQRPVHLFLAVIAHVLFQPLGERGSRRIAGLADDRRGSLATIGYYLQASTRLIERMENVDPVLPHDMLFGIIARPADPGGHAARRRLEPAGVILGFLAYGFLGPWFPGWLKFQGFDPELYIEILTMTGHGIMGITTETSVTLGLLLHRLRRRSTRPRAAASSSSTWPCARSAARRAARPSRR